MKKIKINFGVLLFFPLILSSCGGGKKEEEKFTLPDPPTDLKYEVTAGNQSNTGADVNLISITGTNVNIREQPNTNAAVLFQVNPIDQLTLLEKGNVETIGGKTDHWYRVKTQNQKEGWVFGTFTSLKQGDLPSSSTNIDGPLSGYMEAVPGLYLLELEKREDKYLLGYTGKIKVKFRFIKSLDVKAGSGYNSYGPSIKAKAHDEQGVPLDFELNHTASEELAEYLKRGSGEEWITLNIVGQGLCKDTTDAAKQLAMFNKGKHIQFNSDIVEEKFDDESSSSGSSSKRNDKTSSSDDCDELLSGYEKFMVDYIAVMKKYKNDPSDPSILSEYTSIMSESTEWTTKTADCAADIRFAAKFSKIQMKIANAASGL